MCIWQLCSDVAVELLKFGLSFENFDSKNGVIWLRKEIEMRFVDFSSEEQFGQVCFWDLRYDYSIIRLVYTCIQSWQKSFWHFGHIWGCLSCCEQIKQWIIWDIESKEGVVCIYASYFGFLYN